MLALVVIFSISLHVDFIQNFEMDRNKKLYEKSKYIVKKWESEFKKTTGTLPTKVDIKAAPSKIKEAYKIYWSLKNQVLSKSRSSCDLTVDENAKDCFNSSSENADDSVTNESKSCKNLEDSMCYQPLSETLSDSQFLCSPPNLDVSSSALAIPPRESPKSGSEEFEKGGIPSSFQNIFSKESIEEDELEKSRLRKLEERSVSSQYAKKLFVGSKFNKQNPRKPRKFSRSKTADCISDKSVSESLPGDSGTNLNKALSFAEGNVKCSQESSFSSISDIPSFINDCQDESALIFPDKFKIVGRDQPSASQPVSLLQKSFDLGTSKPSLSRSIDKGWLDRIEELYNKEPEKKVENPIESEDSGISSFKSDASLNPSLEPTAPPQIDSDEDLIYDSDPESQSQSFLQFSLFDKLNKSSANSSFVRNEASSNCFAVKPKEVDVPVKPCLPSIENHIDSKPESILNPKKRVFSELGDSSKKEPKKVKLESSLEKVSEYSFNSSTKPELILPYDSKSKVKSKAKSTASANSEKENKKLALLEKKLNSGAANENFVRINIEKKRYVRGKKTMTSAKYKKQKWKEIKKSRGGFGGTSGVLKCFKCGDVGHLSKACPNKRDGLTPLEEYSSSEESPLPSLEEAAEVAREASTAAHPSGRKFTLPQPTEIGPPAEVEDFPELRGEQIKPVYQLRPDGSLIDTPEEVLAALRELGHTSFRPGQERGVMRILSGLSTLVTLSTGSGKSLIYQLPAYIYSQLYPGCLTLVISPLVSLMEDQVYCGSKKLRAACLHTNMPAKRREGVMEAIKLRQISVLLLAPESLASSWDSARSLLTILPPIAFVCIDEAHSISHFSHNFRPSYLTICQVLREKLGVKTLLGLTATASRATLETVMSQLGIPPEEREEVISNTPLPDNLQLSVSQVEGDRREALLQLLSGWERFSSCSSVIVYCTRREECDSLAAFLRAALQGSEGQNKEGRISLHAEAYHAGLTAARRSKVQTAFMTGKLRMVVATVAFGMGINKNDIRAIIHYNMPYSFESYVQEIGRAGRDGKPAHCHLFLDSKRNDLCELQRHIYADSMDRVILRRLLQMVFIPCDCREKKPEPAENDDAVIAERKEVERCCGHEVAFPIEETVKSLDLPQAVISTLLAYLQLDSRRSWIKVLPLAYTKCKISSYKGPRLLKTTARSCPPLAVVMAQNQGNDSNCLEFDIIELSRKINWDSGTLKHTLKQLEWTTVNDKPRKSGLSVEFSCLGFRVLAPGDLDGPELDEALDLLHSKVLHQEESRLKQLTLFYDSLKRVSCRSIEECSESEDNTQSESLKAEVRKYFTEKDPLGHVKLPKNDILDEGEVCSDIRRFIVMYQNDATLHGRAIARVFHGIGSPNFPPIVWGRTKFWRLHLDKDFNTLVKLSNKQIILMK